MLTQLLGIFLKLDLSCDELLVLRSPVDFACLLVLELYEIILSSHSHRILSYLPKKSKIRGCS